VDGKAGSWFLISWPDDGAPAIEMEFRTSEEAEAARKRALQASQRRRRGDFTTGVCPASALTRDALLRNALIVWDEQLEEMESIERRVLRGG
jgi:hypothetical protein